MITKEQAMTADNFVQTHRYGVLEYDPIKRVYRPTVTTCAHATWRRNGKTKTWKSTDRTEHFRVPVKHGMYNYGYIEYSYEQDNRELFEVFQSAPSG